MRLGLPLEHPTVHRLASWTLLSQNLQAKLASGQMVDINDLARVDSVLSEIRNEVNPQLPPSVELKIVDRRLKSCPFCHNTFDPHDSDPKPLSLTPDGSARPRRKMGALRTLLLRLRRHPIRHPRPQNPPRRSRDGRTRDLRPRAATSLTTRLLSAMLNLGAVILVTAIAILILRLATY